MLRGIRRQMNDVLGVRVQKGIGRLMYKFHLPDGG